LLTIVVGCDCDGVGGPYNLTVLTLP
jgi:hypothetical protein